MRLNPMKLYHGTNERAARVILEGDSIQPHGSRPGNFDDDAPSGVDRVYLATGFAPYYAAKACGVWDDDYADDRQPSERLTIFEVDIDRLDQKKLVPDEDFIYRVCGARPTTKQEQLQQLCCVRDNILQYRTRWRESLDGLGTCAHLGTVPREAIIRVSFFEYTSNPDILGLLSEDVSLDDHQVNGRYYRSLTRWFFKDVDLTVADLMGRIPENCSPELREILEEERAGIEKTMRQQRGLEVRDLL
jgi:hypothetical protein